MRFLSEKILERSLFGALCKAVTILPSLAPAISRFCGAINMASVFSMKEFFACADPIFKKHGGGPTGAKFTTLGPTNSGRFTLTGKDSAEFAKNSIQDGFS